MTTTYRLVAIPGDGVGPDVTAAARRVLEAAAETLDFRLEWDEILVGGIAIDTYGRPIRDEDLALAQRPAAFNVLYVEN